ncbi:DUF308 domain-containing protein [Halovivax sp.]|uniref:HdeD family acid-resistance protein n=1 Tax=Halovivax sp. TaxID=1935978 RepID=UPI0025C042E4|nr:DUF308 domain-containing protein [Halovivax sp.]
MSTVTTESGTVTRQGGWRTLALAGGAVAVVGLLAIALPFATGVAITYVIGALLLLGGLVHAGHAFTVRGWKRSFWQGTLAAVSIVAGVVLLANPIVGLLSLTLLVIAYLLVDGIAELWLSLRMGDESGRGWIAASGALSLVLAGVLWAGFPIDALWIVGVVVGVSLLATGLSMIAVANVGRHADEPERTPGTEPRGV